MLDLAAILTNANDALLPGLLCEKLHLTGMVMPPSWQCWRPSLGGGWRTSRGTARWSDVRRKLAQPLHWA
jgi:hypothetical protein